MCRNGLSYRRKIKELRLPNFFRPDYGDDGNLVALTYRFKWPGMQWNRNVQEDFLLLFADATFTRYSVWNVSIVGHLVGQDDQSNENSQEGQAFGGSCSPVPVLALT
jgi:hypothetical protein